MAINSTTTGPLRTAAIFLSSGTFIPPEGVSRAFVSIIGASGGQGNMRRYRQSGAGGGGVLTGAWVQVVPGQPHSVTIGAGGAGGAAASNSDNAGSTGGQSVFDGALIANGGAGSAGAWSSSTGAGAAGSASAETALPTINPGASTLARATGLVSQTTGGQTTPFVTTNDRYGPSNQSGGTGLNAKIYIFI